MAVGKSPEVAERELADAALRESEDKFRHLFEDSVIGWSITRISGEITVNRAFCEMVGYARSELDHATWQALSHPSDIAETAREMAALLSGEKLSARFEKRFIHKNGSIVWVDVASTLRRNEAGNPLYFMTSLIDVTARKKAEEELRESDLRYRQMFTEHSAVMLLIDSLSGRIVDANPAALAFYGYSRETLCRMNIDQINTLSPAEVAEVRKAIQERRQNIWNFRHRLESGDVRDVEVHSAPFHFKGQALQYSIIHDITARKRAEQERQKLEEQLRLSQRMEAIGSLAGGVAHDFNNMLGVILGHAELALLQMEPDHPLSPSVQAIRSAAERSADLTRQLLAFARKQTVAPKVLDLNETVHGMLGMLRRIIGEDVRFNWKPGDGLGPVRMDPAQVDQILANLCVNARDAIDGVGSILIETQAVSIVEASQSDRTGAAPGDYVVLSVHDSGCGMDEETQTRIFEPFFTTKAVGKGTGLGLATVYGIVKQNHGFIDVHSERGKGSIFRIYLPRYGGEPEPLHTEAPKEALALGRETVLLVEDEPENLIVYKRLLEGLGYQVLAAGGAADAMRMAVEHAGEIHLLLTDVVMPEMNGRELAERLRATRENLRCLFMSGYTADVIAHHGVLEDGVQFIQKPFSAKDVAARLREILAKGSSS